MIQLRRETTAGKSVDFGKSRCHHRAVPGTNAVDILLFALPDPEHSRAARLILILAYAAAAWLWWRAGRRTQTMVDGLFWRVGAGLLTLLAINKFFDLRQLSEAGMRAVAHAGDWYDRRQPVQFALAIVLPLLLAVIAVVFTATKGKRFLSQRPAALAGWFLLMLYLALRQSQEWKPSRAWLDAIHYRDWRMALEIVGISLVILSAIMSQRSSQPTT